MVSHLLIQQPARNAINFLSNSCIHLQHIRIQRSRKLRTHLWNTGMNLIMFKFAVNPTKTSTGTALYTFYLDESNANLDCLSHILVEAYTKGIKEKLERQEYLNKTFVEALNAHCYNEQKRRSMN